MACASVGEAAPRALYCPRVRRRFVHVDHDRFGRIVAAGRNAVTGTLRKRSRRLGRVSPDVNERVHEHTATAQESCSSGINTVRIPG